ncbi:MAG: hypothetical protein KDB14_08765 [Planctomycetales bacterium]|nr:hypothetical protein [Planctomycetales bacterium]
MAKVRRKIHRVQRQRAYFDEQQWPVNLALFVLGGFLIGAAIAYQGFDEPRWYANAMTAVIGVPILIGMVIFTLKRVTNRAIRRGMQLAVVLSLMVHLIMIIASVELNIFDRTISDVVQPREMVERRVSDYSPFRPREQQDHERPIETPVPEMNDDPVEREEAEETQAMPQPTPVPEPQPNANPSVAQRQNREAPTPTPRMSESPSRLSRSQASVTPNLARAAANPNSTQSANREPTLQAAESAVQRRSADQAEASRVAMAEPTAASSSAAVQRRSTERQQPAETSAEAAPTLPRRVNQPSRVPLADSSSQEMPSEAQRTSPDALQAAPTEAVRRQTASPLASRATAEPTPDQPTVNSSEPRTRQQPTPIETQVASTNESRPARQERVTARTESQTMAQVVAPSPSPNSASPQLTQAASTAVTRASTSVDAQRAAAAEASSPSLSPSRSQVARRESNAPAEDSPDVSPTRVARRSADTPSTLADAPQATADAATARSVQADAPLSASSASAVQSPTRRPDAARATGALAAATSSQPSSNPSPSRADRSESSNSPVVAQVAGAIGRRQPDSARQQLASAASPTEQTTAPVATASAGLRATESTLSRQPTNSPGAADHNRPSQSQPSASADNQLAQSSAQRSSPSDTPTVQPAVAASMPRRAANAGELASPTPVDNPALAKSSQSDGNEPSMQAAPTALSRGAAGMAGIGRSANLDRSDPAAESPSMVASGAARRRESTSADEAVSELSDSQPALVARNRAGELRPSSVLLAQEAPAATAAGAEQPAELTASAGAAMNHSASGAAPGAVNATKGTSEVDIGPTRLVSNNGADRAAGGGQAELNFEAQNQAVARNSRGGETTMTLAAMDAAPAPSAPEADGGGEPQVLAPSSTAVAQRMDAGGEEVASGGPSRAAAEGPSAEANAAEQLAALQIARAADDQRQEPGGAAGGTEGDRSDEDEEERARRLAQARRAGGAPEVAIAGADPSDIAESASGSPPADVASGAATPDAASALVARQAPAAGGMNRPSGAESSVGSAAAVEGGAEVAGDVRVRRAEAAEAVVGMASPGGGTDSPRRAASGPQLVADTQAAEVSLAGLPDSSGNPRGSTLAAQGVEVGRAASGRAPTAPGPIGAVADDMIASGSGAAAGAVRATRSDASAASTGPAVSAGEASGGPSRQYARLDAPDADEVASPSELLAAVPVGSGEQMAASLAAAATQVGRAARAASDATLEVEVDAVEGPSGLLSELGAPGINQRRTQTDSVELASATPKFLRKTTGGLPDINTAAIAAATPFQRRAQRGRGETGGDPGEPGPETERAIEAGLVFLAKYQLPDGSWSLKGINNEPVSYSSDGAATGLCLLAFQGAGYNHREHKYAEVVRAGLDFLLKNQQENGSLYVPADERSNEFSQLYTQGIATIALCEAYGMTQDPALREPAQRALNYIMDTQDRTYGGWRYTPGRAGQSDTSVTGWMMMALKSGQLAGLKVEKDTFTRIQLWLDRAQMSADKRHLYVYNPMAKDTAARRLGKEVSRSMTSVGLLSRLYLGWERDNRNMVAGADYLVEPDNLPAIGFASENNPLKKKRDTYYWYYGTQVMFHMGGDHWRQWKAALRPILIDSQVKTGELAGSWDPYQPVPDRWGLAVGRLYVTTLNLLSLEVYWRHLPLYDEHAADDIE